MMIARREGQLLQFKRVLKLLEDALGADELDGPSAPERLKSQVSGLRIDVEPSALDELVSRFPEIPRDECRRLVAEWAVEGLKSARAEAVSLLEGVEHEFSKKPEGASVDVDPLARIQDDRVCQWLRSRGLP